MSAEFIGRGEEIATLIDAIGDGVVTLVGAGGVGKTTTARRAAEQSGRDFVVVELTSLRADDVASALDAATAGLLVIDNAEHVADAVALWLRDKDVNALVTSRVPLRLRNERVIELAPLPVDDSVALFNARAERAGARSSDDLAVAELCRRLDQLPLAIELAAARARLLAPSVMAERLDDRFRVLGEDKHASQEHHRTLREAIAWSYDLLTAEEQTAFRRLAVFADRFDLDQARHVGVDLEAMSALVDHSLVMSEPDALVPYRLLESVREFARELGDDEPIDGLVAWLVETTAPLDEALTNREPLHRRLDFSAVDIRNALEHAPPGVAVTLFGRLGAWYWDRGRAEEGLRIGHRLVGRDPQTDGLATARLLNAVANLAVRAGDPDAALPHYERALGLRTELGVSTNQLASNRNDLGACLLHLGRLEEAESSLVAARDLYASCGDRWGVATATANLAAVAVTAGRLEGAAGAFAEVAAEFTKLGDDVQAAAAFTNQGLVLLQLEHPEAAGVLARAVRTSLRAGMRAVLPAALAGCASAAGTTPRASRLLGAAAAAGFMDDGELRAPLENALGLDHVRALIAEGAAATDDEILTWCEPVIPHREKLGAESQAAWTKAERGWSVTFEGETAELPAIKGMQFLAQLLAAPDIEFHVTELMGVSATQAGTEAADEAALAAYRQRVRELQRKLDDADQRGDARVGVAAQAELDQLTAELRRSTSKNGRIRLTGDDNERARKAVSNRIRDAIRTILDVHPVLGRHLEKSVSTGTFCSYAPERAVHWQM